LIPSTFSTPWPPPWAGVGVRSLTPVPRTPDPAPAPDPTSLGDPVTAPDPPAAPGAAPRPAADLNIVPL
jgi:hypothetical protein